MAEFAKRPYGAVPGWDQRDIERDPAGYARALIDEAHSFTGDDLQQKPWYQRWYENPGFLSAVPKTEREKLDDAKQAYVLKNLTGNVPPAMLHRLEDLRVNGVMTDDHVGNLTRAYALYGDNESRLDSDYRTHGFMGAVTPGSRGYGAIEWMSAVPAVATGASGALADYADKVVSERSGIRPNPQNPEALSQIMQAGQTFLPGRMPTDRIDEISYPEARERKAKALEKLLPADSWLNGELLGGLNLPAYRESKDRVGTRMQSQRELLTQSGVPEAPAALLGVLHDMAFDPFSSVGSSVRLARAGMSGQAIRNLAQESYLYGGFLGDEGIRSLGDLRFDDMPKYYIPQE